MLSSKALCSCHYHVHTPGQAHKGHAKCALSYRTCDHPEDFDDSDDEAGPTVASGDSASIMRALMGLGLGGGLGH